MAATPQSLVHDLLSAPENEQHAQGYFHTLHEILQQPATWRETARQVAADAGRMRTVLEGIRSVIITGSGSSLYVGDCCAPFLRTRLARTVQAVGGGDIVL